MDASSANLLSQKLPLDPSYLSESLGWPNAPQAPFLVFAGGLYTNSFAAFGKVGLETKIRPMVNCLLTK
jgi:hypothetical protein